MQYHSLKAAPIRPDDLVFRESWIIKLIPLITALALFAVPAVLAWREHSIILGLVSTFGLLFVLLVVSTMRHTFHAANWLVRAQPGGLLIKFRSYLNDHFSDDDPVVLELRADELAWAGKTVVHTIAPGSEGGVTSTRTTYLDLKPKQDDLSNLEAQLKEERLRPASGKFIQTKCHDYPVRVAEGGIIRLTWSSPASRVIPTADKALAKLQVLLRISIRPPEKIQLDLVTDPKDRAKQEQRVLDLLESGDRMAAVRLVRRLYGYSTTEAVRFVDDLQGRPAPTGSPGGQD